ncbi:MAG: OmpH family outer membrane protein [Candidatus Omnitrophica bacterium]|nr:OmpH family outer membrane protein [Candidatus Omnitrophota bacterium]
MKKFKFDISAVLCAAIISSLIFGFAGTSGAEEKMGVVQLEKVFNEYQKTKELDSILEEKGKSTQDERQNKVDAIRKMKDELELLSEKGKEEKQAKIDEKIQELQTFDRDKTNTLKKEHDQYMREILKEISDKIEAYGKDKGYSMILSDRAILYSDEEIDLTDKVLEDLNKGYKKSE